MAFKPIDPKRDEFRRYLERAGVIEALTKMFVRLVKERPENPMEFLQAKLGDSKLQADHEAYLLSELEEARAEIQRLRNRILALDPKALDDEKQTSPAEVNEDKNTTELVSNENQETDTAEKDTNKKETKAEDATTIINSEANVKEPQEECLEKENTEVPVYDDSTGKNNVKDSPHSNN